MCKKTNKELKEGLKNIPIYKHEYKKVTDLREDLYDDFFNILTSYCDDSIKELLENEEDMERFMYFEEQILNNAETIVWNLCIYDCDTELLSEEEIKEVLKGFDKKWYEISYTELSKCISNYISKRDKY